MDGNCVLTNKDSDDLMPIQIAAASADSSILSYLKDNGSPIDIRDPEGNTLLHRAVKGQLICNVEYLIDIGLDVNALDNIFHFCMIFFMFL